MIVLGFERQLVKNMKSWYENNLGVLPLPFKVQNKQTTSYPPLSKKPPKTNYKEKEKSYREKQATNQLAKTTEKLTLCFCLRNCHLLKSLWMF